MNIPTAIEMKKALQERLTDLLEALSEHRALSRMFVSYGVDDIHSPATMLAVPKAITHYFNELANTLTLAHNGGTPAKIDLKDTYGLSTPKVRSLLSRPSSNIPDDFVEQLVGLLDFEAVEAELQKQVAALKSNGLSLQAELIMYSLSLSSDLHPPKFMARVCAAEGCKIRGTYSRTDTEHLHELKSALVAAADMAGIDIGSAIDDYTQAAEALTYFQPDLLDRKTFGKGDALEIAVFKGLARYRLSYELLDAICEFFRLHGNAKTQSCADRLQAGKQSAQAA